MALGVSDRLDAAADTAQRLLEGREEPGGMLAPIAQRLGLDQVQALGAFALLRHLASVRPGAEGRPPQCELWQFGISGDLPIAAAPLEGGVGEDKIGLWCAQHRFLTRAGWPFDLVFLAEEGGDYRRPLLTAVRGGAAGAGGGIRPWGPGRGPPGGPRGGISHRVGLGLRPPAPGTDGGRAGALDASAGGVGPPGARPLAL